MSGLRKQKKYNWRETNLALFGSDLDKQVKKEAAETEAAWAGVGKEVGLRIWRIVKFQVQKWPKSEYGKFYNGDSYIILNTYKDEEELKFDVHFWIGRYSSQDEYGTAAYKTVELDTFLDDAALQHRETQGHESDLFLSYFKTMTVMSGGADSGFRHVKPEEYKPRLLHFSGSRRTINVTEVALSKDRLNDDDVFILDLGLQLYQWNGSGANKDERFKAAQMCQQIEGERGRCQTEVLDQDSTPSSHEFYEKLTGDMEDDDDDEEGEEEQTQLFKVSDETGSLQMGKIKDGSISLADFQSKGDSPPRVPQGCLSCIGGKKSKRTKVSKDVFLMETGKECFIWIGSGASTAEKKNGFTYAHSHLMKSNKPYKNITVLKEGQRCASFTTAMAA